MNRLLMSHALLVLVALSLTAFVVVASIVSLICALLPLRTACGILRMRDVGSLSNGADPDEQRAGGWCEPVPRQRELPFPIPASFRWPPIPGRACVGRC